MAAVVAGVSAASTTDDSALTTGSFTPDADDLLIVFAYCTGQTGTSGGSFSDTQGLGWYELPAGAASGTDTITMGISQVPATNDSMTVTFTPASTPSTGVAISVLRVSGMTRYGSSAIRLIMGVGQLGITNSGLATFAPTGPIPGTCLTGNPIVGAVGNGTNPATITEPAFFTEVHDIGYSTPATGLETMSRDSGFTGSTVTWGLASLSDFCSVALELDTSSPVAFNSAFATGCNEILQAGI